jgi:transketolase
MRGFFPLDAFESFNQVGSYFSMHADAHVPGVEHSAGSLGHGLSVASGMALAGKLDQKDYQVYCILGDGELMEGSNWEAFMSTAHFELDNVTAIIDRNHLSQEGTTEDTMRLEPLAEKMISFGWQPIEVDGHSIPEILDAFQLDSGGKPKVIIANTIKGRGIDGIANTIGSHFGHLDEKQTKLALDQINSEE